MKTKILTLVFAVIFSLTAIIATPVHAEADICNQPGVSDSVKAAAGCSETKNESITKFETVIMNIVNSVILISGIIAVIFIVKGGITYMTSSGDAAKLKLAKDTIIYAAIGLIICALAAITVNFVVGAINNNGKVKDDNKDKKEDSALVIQDIAFLEK